jgi:hypothetical protein
MAVSAGVAACIAIFGQDTNQCDNFAGTCLRDRQRLAIFVIQFAAPVAAGVALLGLVLAAGRRRLAPLLVVAILAGAVFSVGVLVADPVSHLNNSRTGWLAR